jgi:HD-like signal output (HDOD) protein
MSLDAVTLLLARHEQLPARKGAAVKVLSQVEDPDVSVQELARTIASDSLLAAKLLRVANSPYYGLSGRVGTLPFAVSVVGFSTVRTLAVAAAAGLDDPKATPEDFWAAGAAAATAAELVAPILGAHLGDAFTLGLLHLIGSALLHQHHPLPALCLPEDVPTAELLRVETEQYGICHHAAGARVMAAWHVPAEICGVIDRHHEPLLPDSGPLERALHIARTLAGPLLRRGAAGDGFADIPEQSGPTFAALCDTLAWQSGGRITADAVPGLLVRVQERSLGLLQGLAPRQ